MVLITQIITMITTSQGANKSPKPTNPIKTNGPIALLLSISTPPIVGKLYYTTRCFLHKYEILNIYFVILELIIFKYEL